MANYYIWTGDGKLFVFCDIHLDPEEDQVNAFEEWYIFNDIDSYTGCSFNDMDWGEVEEPTVQVITPEEPWKTEPDKRKSESESDSDN
jgi:hypothetical protein